MRAALFTLLVLVCLGTLPLPLAAEEPPPAPSAPTPPAAPGATDAEEPKPAAKPAAAEEQAPTPTALWKELNKSTARLPRAQRAAQQEEKARALLAGLSSGDAAWTGEDLYSLGLLQRTAKQAAEALKTFRALSGTATEDVTTMDKAAVAEAGLLLEDKVREIEGTEGLAAATDRLLAYAITMQGDARLNRQGNLRLSLAKLLDKAERKADALSLRMAIALADPKMTSRVRRPVVHGLLGSTHEMDGYPTVRTVSGGILTVLEHQQSLAVAMAREGVSAAREAHETHPSVASKRALAQAERTLRSAEFALKRYGGARKPFEMLGRPVPTWTLSKAFGTCEQVTDLKGKVVILDFWATWCPWCIKSFPAIRDLLRDYEARGLVVVGVTASSNAVFEQRYDLDEDLKHKLPAGERPKVTARLATKKNPADGKQYFGAKDYPTREQEVIADFIKNHAMTWPVVMIDKTEPGPKYALGGWPHAVVIDRAGNVRYFKSGALLRDRKEAVATFRKLIEDLLKEPAPKAAR